MAMVIQGGLCTVLKIIYSENRPLVYPVHPFKDKNEDIHKTKNSTRLKLGFLCT